MTRERGVPLRLLPPPATVGVTMAVNGGRGGNGLPFGAAIATVALAVAAFTAAIGLGSSLTALTGAPNASARRGTSRSPSPTTPRRGWS